MARVPRRRASFLLLVILLGMVGMGARLSLVQGLRASEYSALARQQRVRKIDLPAIRGAIYDRAGREMAMSVPARTVYANPRQIVDPESTARTLAPLIGVSADAIAAQLRKPRGFVYLARRIDVERADKVDGLRLPGVGTLDEHRRTYPGGLLGANVLGFVGTDATGLAGLEASYEALLRGKPGFRVLEQDPTGRPIPQGLSSELPPIAGSDLVLTIDRDIQFAAEQSLRRAVDDYSAKGGSVVVVRVKTGEILAMANAPTFDPNDIAGIDLLETRNRAVTDAYEPGSVNKVVTASAALEEGVARPESPYSVPAVIGVAGARFSDAHGHATKTMRFEDIIAQSSNVGTIKVALQLGAKRLEDYLERFGYGRSTALGYPGESTGILPSATRWNTSLPTMAIGQGVSVTALQLVRVYAAVANGGVSVEPKLVDGWVDPDGTLHKAPASRTWRVVSEQTAATMRAILTRVVTDGTGKLAQVPGYATAGKTGTAQKPGPHGGYQGYMASFFGFLPAAAPELAIGVTLDDPRPYWGGVAAAPVFREVGLQSVRILRIPPTELPALLPPEGATLATAEGPSVAQGPPPAVETPVARKPT